MGEAGTGLEVDIGLAGYIHSAVVAAVVAAAAAVAVPRFARQRNFVCDQSSIRGCHIWPQLLGFPLMSRSHPLHID